MDPIPLPPPYGGVNQRIPKVAIQSPQCESLINFNPVSDGVSLRRGDQVFKFFTSAVSTDQLICLVAANYNDRNVIILVENITTNKREFYDALTGLVIYSTAIAALSLTFQSVYFNRYLFFFCPDGSETPGYTFDGASIGTIGYTPFDAGAFAPVSGFVYKNRMYVINKDTGEYLYSDINAISGPLYRVDLSQISKSGSDLAIITSVGVSDNISSIVLLAFIFKNGEVLFYSGSYPDSSDWQLVGQAQIGYPLNYDAALLYQGDTWIFCRSGIYSLRELFLKGSQQGASLDLSSNINKSWVLLQNYLFASYSGSFVEWTYKNIINAVVDTLNNRIIISFRFNNIGLGGGVEIPCYFIFNTELQSWFLHVQDIAGSGASVDRDCLFDMGLFNGQVVTYFTSSNYSGALEDVGVAMKIKEGAEGYTDRNMFSTISYPYSYEIISAPIANGRAYVQQAEGMDVILETDLDSQTEYTFIKDLGVGSTSPQKLPVNPGGIQKPYVNMGIEGSYIQYKISGSTTTGKTVGLNIYGTNVWIQNGKSPR